MNVDRSDRKEWAREHFVGFENVLMPSFTPDMSALDEEGIRRDVRMSKQHGFFSSLCSVETGLTREETRQFLEIAADEAGPDYGIALSLTAPTLEENIELLDHAESTGLTHGLISYPHGFRPESQDEIYNWVEALSESTNLGLYLFCSGKYSFHNLHPSGVPFDAFDRAANLPNVVAMKVGGMDSGMIFECFERFSDRLLVASVNLALAPMLSEIYGQQWSGAWTVEALQSPDKPYAVDFFELLANGQTEEAMKVYWNLAPMVGVMGQAMGALVPTGAYHWPMLKYYQWFHGGNGGYTRQPTMRVFQRDMTNIRMGFGRIGIEAVDETDDSFFLGRSNYGKEAA